MAVRIYALAKELKLDSKELVDICTRLGVTGKGSALASLDDDELAKVRAHLAHASQRSAGHGAAAHAPAAHAAAAHGTAAPPVPTRPSEPPRGPIRNLTAPRPAPAAPTPVLEVTEPVAESSAPVGTAAPSAAPSAGEETADVPAVQAEAPADASVATTTPIPGAKAPRTPPLSAPAANGGASGNRAITRDDYIAPGGNAGARPRSLLGSGKKPPIDITKKSKSSADQADGGGAGGAGSTGAGKTAGRKAPVIKLAAIPKSRQPSEAPAPKEPAPQKPIMTLSAEAIRGVKSGSRAPLEQHLASKGNEKRRPGDSSAKTPEMIGGESAAAKASKARRGGKPLTPEEAELERSLLGMAGARAVRQKDRKVRSTVPTSGEEEDRPRHRKLTRGRGKVTPKSSSAPRKGNVVLTVPCTLRAFSEATGVGSTDVLRRLMQLGTMATINTIIGQETAELLVADMGVELEFRSAESLEDSLLAGIKSQEDDDSQLEARPPIVTVLGHVDHGKTSLLDRIIGINVVKGEAGGITQHIRAYSVKKDGRTIAFVDTPGHEAFTEMRARGANVTDIAVLVVAADDGVMPQTEEAISHAKAAGVPIVVALNKIDLPGVNIDNIYQQLAQHDLLPSEWGGEVEVVKTSALTGQGIDTLLETLLLTADLHEYRANPNRAAFGVCLEAEQEPGRGVIAKMIVQNGTLKLGDVVVCGAAHGRVKAMYNTLKITQKVKEAGPSIPVNLIGLDIAPQAGESFFVIDDLSKARELAMQRASITRELSLAGRQSRVSFEDFQKRLTEGRLASGEEAATLNLILRADTRGSIEAIQKELGKLDHPEVKIKLLQSSVGAISVGDVTLADASDAVIVGFNVIPDEVARNLADERGVEIRRYDIIYKLAEDLKLMLEGKLKPEERVKELGRALVLRVFNISRVGTVAGCRVLAGVIERNCRIRVNRDGRGIGDYGLDSLKREKDDAKEVREGYECGLRLSGFNDLKEGDVLEAYKIEEVARTM